MKTKQKERNKEITQRFIAATQKEKNKARNLAKTQFQHLSVIY